MPIEDKNAAAAFEEFRRKATDDLNIHRGSFANIAKALTAHDEVFRRAALGLFPYNQFLDASRTASRHLETLTKATSIANDLQRIAKAYDLPAFAGMRDLVTEFEKRFRQINNSEFAKLTGIIAQSALPSWAEEIRSRALDFERQFAALRSPIIDINNSWSSLKGLGELTKIGAAIRTSTPFNVELNTFLRQDLGDWRDFELDASPLLDDPAARIGIYEENGFNSDLTNFPADGFDDVVSITQIKLGTVAAELSPPPTGDVPSHNQIAYQWLFVLERELRDFIQKKLSSETSGGWKSRLPQGMHERWLTKKSQAMNNGENEQPLINYVDFTDYNEILLKSANWRDYFKAIFKREEAVREAFNRLRPIRLVVAHMRVMTAEELLVLNIEVRRILRAIGVL